MPKKATAGPGVLVGGTAVAVGGTGVLVGAVVGDGAAVVTTTGAVVTAAVVAGAVELATAGVLVVFSATAVAVCSAGFEPPNSTINKTTAIIKVTKTPPRINHKRLLERGAAAATTKGRLSGGGVLLMGVGVGG